MSKLLIQLLGINEKNFQQYINKLEKACLYPGVDIKLSAEIISKTREKARNLGLDVADTTAKELFYGLKSKLSDDDKQLQDVLKLSSSSPSKTAKQLAINARKLSGNEKCLSLTSAGTKRILVAVPPKKTLRVLKLRSLESVLKRENSKLLYSLACLIEDRTWISQVHAKMRRLDSRDVIWQKVEIIELPFNWYERLEKSIDIKGMHFINAETGLVCVMPAVKSIKPGTTTLLIALILQSVQNLSIISLPYKKQAFTQGHNQVLPEISMGVQPVLISMHGLQPTWEVVHQIFAKGYLSVNTSDIDFIVDDLYWDSIEIKLASLVSSMDFWVDSHYLGAYSAIKPTSLHILDIASAVSADSKFGEHSTLNFEKSLINEVQARYLEQDVLSHSLINQLTKDSSAMVV